jgi:antitoxin component of RelBE/YafQ-DinJ toxin-antitoxin module
MFGRGFRVFRLHIAAAFFVGFSCSMVVADSAPAHDTKNAGQIGYGEIAERLIRVHIGSGDGFERAINKYGVPILSEQEQSALIFSILSKNDSNIDDATPCFMHQAMRNCMGDLEFFGSHASSSDNYLFAKLDHTSSLVGQAVLAKMVMTPSTDVDCLLKRQALIKALLEDEHLFDQVQALINEMKQSESSILSFWVEEESATKADINQFYFSKKRLNKDPRKLEFLARWNYFLTGRGIVEDVLTTAGMIYFAKTIIMGPADPESRVSLWGALVESVKGLVPFTDMYRMYALHSGSMSVEEYLQLEQMYYKNANESGKNRVIVGAGLKALGKGYLLTRRWDTIKILVDELARQRKTLCNMQRKLMRVADFFDGFRKLDELAKNNPTIKHGLHSYTTVEQICACSLGSDDFKELVALLQTPTFKGEPSYYSYQGRVLHAYDLMNENRSEMCMPLEAYGELDACLSVAKLIKKMAHERVGYWFVEYKRNNVPYINIQDFWNPLIDPAIVVTNSLELGASGKERNMILTGSNTGGKSTLLKALSLDVLLAQTLGVAAARSMIVSPFAYFGCSMNITDNTAEGKSLYQAEVDRATSLMRAAVWCQEHGKPCLLVVDELFRGTSPDRADIETYECGKKWASLKQVLFILATHFIKSPTKLEPETNGTCKNYKVEAHIIHGKIKRTYKLEEGINQSNIADALLKEAADNA